MSGNISLEAKKEIVVTDRRLEGSYFTRPVLLANFLRKQAFHGFSCADR